MVEAVADRLRDGALLRDGGQPGLEPSPELFPTNGFVRPVGATFLRAAAADPALDGIECRDPFQRLMGDRRRTGFVEHRLRTRGVSTVCASCHSWAMLTALTQQSGAFRCAQRRDEDIYGLALRTDRALYRCAHLPGLPGNGSRTGQYPGDWVIDENPGGPGILVRSGSKNRSVAANRHCSVAMEPSRLAGRTQSRFPARTLALSGKASEANRAAGKSPDVVGLPPAGRRPLLAQPRHILANMSRPRMRRRTWQSWARRRVCGSFRANLEPGQPFAVPCEHSYVEISTARSTRQPREVC